MEISYIQSANQLYLNIGSRPRFNPAGDLSSKNLSRFSLTKAPFIRSYYCKNCAKIVIDLSENEKVKQKHWHNHDVMK